MIRNIFAPGGQGLFRRIPIFFHLLIVGGLLAIFQILKEPFVNLVLSFNERTTFNWLAIAEFGTLVFGYLFILVLFASTKVLVDWLVEGK